MKPRSYFFLLLPAFIYLNSVAQVTNVRKWRKTEKDSLELGLFLYDEKSYLKALPVFENIYEHHPNEEFIKYVYARCALYRSDKHEEAYRLLTEIYQKNRRVEDILYNLAQAAHYNNKLDEAMQYITEYLDDKRQVFENRKKAELLRQYIANARYYASKPTAAAITGMGTNINSPDDEYTPAITADESVMMFTYKGPKSIGGRQDIYLHPDPKGNYMEDVYMTHKIDNEYIAAFPLDSVNSNAPDAAVSLSNDGSILFTYKNENDNHGDIYMSELSGEHFTRPRKLQGQVNTYSWDGHCSLSPDGKTLYFSSERSGGNGGKDIYRASLSADGSWQNVVNLGDTINTPFDEDAPFIHPDGITLFYSSNCKKSMGGYDVFKAVMNPADSSFRKTENLGFPINTPDDDIYFVLAANSETGYYSSGSRSGKGLRDIYQVETRFSGARPSLYLVKGETQYDGDEVSAGIKVEIPDKNKTFGSFSSNASSGNYLVCLPAGERYRLTYSYKDLPVKTLEIDLVGVAGYSEKTYNVDFKDASAPYTPVAATATSSAKSEAAQKAREEESRIQNETIEKATAKAIADAEAKAQAERAAIELAAARAKAEAEAKAQAERLTIEKAEAKAKADAEAKAQAERLAIERAEVRAKADAEARAQAERLALERAEAKAKADAEAKAQAERLALERAEAKAKAEAEAQARAERLAIERAEARAKAEAEAKAKAELLARQRAEARAKAEAEAKIREEAERIARKRAAEEAAAKAAADARLAAEKAAKAKAEAERLAKEKAEAKARAEEQAKAKAEADPIAREKTAAAAVADLAARKASQEAAAKLRTEKATKEAALSDNPVAIRTRTVALPLTPAVPTETFAPTKDGFVPRSRLQVKAIRYIEKYGDIKAPGLEFKVQLVAFKVDKNQAFPELLRYGKIERIKFPDGYTRMYIGGSFKTLRTAFAHTKRVVLAGQNDAFVCAFYNGQRVTYDELIRIGIFR